MQGTFDDEFTNLLVNQPYIGEAYDHQHDGSKFEIEYNDSNGYQIGPDEKLKFQDNLFSHHITNGDIENQRSDIDIKDEAMDEEPQDPPHRHKFESAQARIEQEKAHMVQFTHITKKPEKKNSDSARGNSRKNSKLTNGENGCPESNTNNNTGNSSNRNDVYLEGEQYFCFNNYTMNRSTSQVLPMEFKDQGKNLGSQVYKRLMKKNCGGAPKEITSKKSNSKNVFMRKINGLLSDDKLLETINKESQWLKDKIQLNADIIKNESNNSLADFAKNCLEGNTKLGALLAKEEDGSDEQLNGIYEDDKCLGKRMKRLSNSESARNSRIRKRLYIELLEEKLKVEERRNQSYVEEIKLLKNESNNMMHQAWQSNKPNNHTSKDAKDTLFKKIMIHRDSSDNLQRIFDDYIADCQDKEKHSKKQAFTNIEGFFNSMKDIGIGSVINFPSSESLNSFKEDCVTSHKDWLPTIDVLARLNMQLVKTSTEFQNTVLSRVSEYIGIRNEIKENINKTIDSIPKKIVHDLLGMAVDKYIEAKKEMKTASELFQSLADMPDEAPIKKIFIPNEDILDII